MKMREIGTDMAISVRLNTQEWNDIKNRGDKLFLNRKVGYMQVIPGKIKFEITSPFYKEMRKLDEKNKEV